MVQIKNLGKAPLGGNGRKVGKHNNVGNGQQLGIARSSNRPMKAPKKA